MSDTISREQRYEELRERLALARERRVIFTTDPGASNIDQIIRDAEDLKERTSAHAKRVRRLHEGG